MPRTGRLAIVVTHPIQHFTPLYRELARQPGIELHVLFGNALGSQPYFDRLMNTEIAWQMDLLSGYSHEFLEPDFSGVPTFFKPNASNLAARLSAFAPDAVMIYGYAQINTLRALGWGTVNDVPLLMVSDSERAFEAGGWRARFKALALPILYRRIAAFLSTGDRNEEYHLHYGATAERIFRSPFTIDEAAYRPAAETRSVARAALLARIGAPDDALIALYVGKLYGGKRPGDLLDALEILGKHSGGERVHAVFAGAGELSDSLVARARTLNAHFLGFVNVDALPAIYAGSDMLVLPSVIDRHPLVCSEAACIGLPLILSDRVGAVGPTDIARPGENAIVFPAGDATALAAAIATLLDDPQRLEAESRRSREIFDECDMAASIAGVRAALDFVFPGETHAA